MEHRALLATFLLAAGFAASGKAQSTQADERSIRALVQVFADARNAHDGPAVAALYSEDGEWISSSGYALQGKEALSRLWSGVTGQVTRTIQSIDFAAPNIAVVRVFTQYAEPTGLRHETFILVKQRGEWNIRVHQSVD